MEGYGNSTYLIAAAFGRLKPNKRVVAMEKYLLVAKRIESRLFRSGPVLQLLAERLREGTLHPKTLWRFASKDRRKWEREWLLLYLFSKAPKLGERAWKERLGERALVILALVSQLPIVMEFKEWEIAQLVEKAREASKGLNKTGWRLAAMQLRGGYREVKITTTFISAAAELRFKSEIPVKDDPLLIVESLEEMVKLINEAGREWEKNRVWPF